MPYRAILNCHAGDCVVIPNLGLNLFQYSFGIFIQMGSIKSKGKMLTSVSMTHPKITAAFSPQMLFAIRRPLSCHTERSEVPDCRTKEIFQHVLTLPIFFQHEEISQTKNSLSLVILPAPTHVVGAQRST